MSQITVIKGDTPIMIVAPHGVKGDDDNSAIVAEVLAKKLDAFAMINTKYKRAKQLNAMKNEANLNSINHCLLEPCRSEFMVPLANNLKYILQDLNYHEAHLFYIHGVGNHIRKDSKSSLDVVVGYGAGNPPSYTCPLAYKDEFCYRLKEAGFDTYVGGPGGRFSACGDDNLCQYWRKKKPNHNIQSLQLEIVFALRATKYAAEQLANRLFDVIWKYVYKKTVVPSNFFVPQIS